MQDAARTSQAWAELADSLVNGPDARPVNAQPRGVSSDVQTPTKCGKKRVRRMQIELPFFRLQVRDLELKLKRLKLQSASRGTIVMASPRSVQNLIQRAPKTDQNSLWNGIAERQLKERLRVEQQRQALKETHAELYNVTTELQKLLKKCDRRQEEVEGRVKSRQEQRYWDYKNDPANEIYADQLAAVARMRLRLQTQEMTPSRALNLGSGLSMGREMVRWDSEVEAGFKFDLQGGTMIPFGLEVAADAYWRLFGCGYGMDHHDNCASDLTSNTIARSFKIRTDFEGYTSKARGKYTARRYSDQDGSVVVVWVGSGDVQEIAGTNFAGIQLHKRGCIKLRRAPRQGPGEQSTSTIVEATLETIPVFHQSVVDKAQQTQRLLESLDKSYCAVDKLFCQRLGALLVEEDWKATFGSEKAVEA